jgi:hypothetical protein
MQSLIAITISSTIRSLGLNCFENCQKPEFIFLNEGIQYIGDYCLSGCCLLIKIFLSSVLYIDDCCFSGCGQLESIIL